MSCPPPPTAEGQVLPIDSGLGLPPTGARVDPLPPEASRLCVSVPR